MELTKNNKILIVIGIILLAVYFQTGGKLSKKIACTAPENAEVIFRTNVNGKFGNFFATKDTTWIALRYDTGTNSETSNLIPYRYVNINTACSFNSTAGYVILPYAAPNGALLAYKEGQANPPISIFEPIDCPSGKYSRSWYSYNDTIPTELSLSPTEPYVSSCQEVYKTITFTPPPPPNLYESFLAIKYTYLNGGTFSDFIVSANEWVIS